MSKYQFTNTWFDQTARATWDAMFAQFSATKILEVGSYEGASSCYLVEQLANERDIELHCVDTWEGGVENIAEGADMASVEARFKHNIRAAISTAPRKVELFLYKGYSDLHLARLLSEGKRNYFDFIYIDGSHQAPDVLCDAVLAFRLLKVGGLMAFDDYLWSEKLPYGKDPVRCPKPAIDAFTTLYCRKLDIIKAPLYQLYIQKTSD